MNRLKHIFNKESGFTLIELLIVIAVLGILAGIAVPRITGVRQDAANSAAQATASSIRNAFEMYYAKYGYYPVISSTEPTLTKIQTALTKYDSDGNGSITGADATTSSIQISVPEDTEYTVTVTDAVDSLNDSSYRITITHNQGNKTYILTPTGISSTS